MPPPLHLASSSISDSRLPQAYQTNVGGSSTAGTSSVNAATYGARTSSNAANAVHLAAPLGFASRSAASPLSAVGSYSTGTPANQAPPPVSSNPKSGSSGSRSQQHLAAPTIATTAASPTAISPSRVGQWSHHKAGSLGGSNSSPSQGGSHPIAVTSQSQGGPSPAAASNQQFNQQAVAPCSPTKGILAVTPGLHASSYRGQHAQKPSYGNGGPSTVVEAKSGAVSPATPEQPSSSSRQAQGFTIGKGGFARPTTSGGLASIGATGSSGQAIPLEDVLRRTVKFISDDNVSKMVNLDGAQDVYEVLVRVLRKFNKTSGNIPPPPNTLRGKSDSGEIHAELGGYGIFATNGDGLGA